MGEFFQQVGELFGTPEYMSSLFKGLLTTLLISVFAILVGMILGLLIAVIQTAKDSKWMKIPKGICRVYVAIIRGTPMALQLFMMFFIVFAIRDFPEMITAILAFGLNSAAYASEIFRSGILSVDKGQKEAGESLGLTKWTIFKKIIGPQALKNSILPYGSEIVTVVKETAIVSMVGMYDLNMAAKDIGSGQNMASYVVPMFVVALFYLLIVFLITKGVAILDRRLRESD